MKYKFLLVAIIASTFVFTTFATDDELDPVNSVKPVASKKVNKKKRKAAEDPNKRSKVKRKPAAASSSSNSTAFPPSFVRKPLNIEEKLRQFLRRSHNPLNEIDILPSINAKSEQSGGSRRWTNGFLEDNSYIFEWHLKMAEVIKSLDRNRNGPRSHYLTQSCNIAVCRLVLIAGNNKKEVEVPFFFISGWPGKANKNGALELSKALSSKKIKNDVLKQYSHYGLRFVGNQYKDGESQVVTEGRYRDNFEPFRKALQLVIKREQESAVKILGVDRLRSHKAVLDSAEERSLNGVFYLHSEQAMWMHVKKTIENLKKSVIGDSYIFIDICSLKDMCWCCGDVLASCCHVQELGGKVFVRASGIFDRYDYSPKDNRCVSLRQERKDFGTYEENGPQKVYDVPPSDNYKPYIAHSTVEDMVIDKD